MRRNLLILSTCLASCGAWMQSPDDDTAGGAERSVAVEDVILSTELDLESFSPAGSRGPVFQASTRQLQVSFLVSSGATGSPILVSWYRVGDREPFSTSRLIVTGHRRMAAGYEPITAFEPGGYYVKLETDEQLLSEVGFEIEGAAAAPEEVSSGEPSVSGLRLVRALDDRGRPRGLPATVLPAGSLEVHCSFTMSGALPGTTLSVRWIRGSEIVEVDDLGRVEGEEEMLASLRSREPLQAGLYRAEVLVNGEIARSSSFTVEQAVSAEELGPRVTNLTLTTAVDAETGRATAPTISVVDGGEEGRIYLSVAFSRIPPDSELSVRWFRDAAPQEPIATSTFEVHGRGSFAASLTRSPPMEPGPYHVDVVLFGRTVGSVAFTVEGEPLPSSPDGGDLGGEAGGQE